VAFRINRQQLHAVNVSANISEAIEARTKDPLWFLARQMQSGEFEAENGGRVASVSVSSKEHPLKEVEFAGNTQSIDRSVPLEAIVERENNGDAPAWRSDALEYAFQARTDKHDLNVSEYMGRDLDWYDFDLESESPGSAAEEIGAQLIPNSMTFRGAPESRWWQFESDNAYFDSPDDPEPNTLSTLLPEFFYIDVDNWYTIPAPMTAGSVREITKLLVVDSFGHVTEVPPAIQNDEDWCIFRLSDDRGAGNHAHSGNVLFVPNIASQIVVNDDVEDVRFLRDENANLVFACEHTVTLEDGTRILNGGAAQAPNIGNSAGYRLMSNLARHWIPYVPRRNSAAGVLNGEIYLRRGRSDENASSVNPQFQSKIVAESIRVNEEEVPRSGVRIRRVEKYARGSDGSENFWIGRQKEPGTRSANAGFKTDYIDE